MRHADLVGGHPGCDLLNMPVAQHPDFRFHLLAQLRKREGRNLPPAVHSRIGVEFGALALRHHELELPLIAIRERAILSLAEAPTTHRLEDDLEAIHN